MVRCGKLVLASALMALFVSPAWSQDQPRQRPGGGGQQRPGQRMDMMPGLGLLTEKSVQEELKMSADQIEKAVAARKKETEALGSLRDMDREEANAKRRELDKQSEKMAMEILKPDQAKRLGQILLQQKKSRGLTDERVVKELKLSDDQQKKIKDVQDDIGRQRREAMGGGRNAGGGGGGGREAANEMRQKLTDLDKKAEEKCMEVLSADQKAKWKELLGEPFKGEISFRPQGGRRGEGRPNRDPR